MGTAVVPGCRSDPAGDVSLLLTRSPARHRCHLRTAQQFCRCHASSISTRALPRRFPASGCGEEAAAASSRASGTRQSPGRPREPQKQPRRLRHGTRLNLPWHKQHEPGSSPSRSAALSRSIHPLGQTAGWTDGCPPPSLPPTSPEGLPDPTAISPSSSHICLQAHSYLFICLINCCFHNKRSSFSQPPTALGLDC